MYILSLDYTKEAVSHEFWLNSKKLARREKCLSLENGCFQQSKRSKGLFFFSFFSELI